MNTLSLIRCLRRGGQGEINCDDLTLARLADHGLLGYVHVHWRPFPKARTAEIEKFIASRSLVASVLLAECARLEEELSPQLIGPIVRLKGASLIGEIYRSPDERELTDIDFLIEPQDWKAAGRALRDQGYALVPQIVWSANRYKATFSKVLNCGLTSYIDLHTQILWRQPADLLCAVQRSDDGSFHLRSDWQLVHLVANFAFQDNFVSLKKLLDIDLWLKAHASSRGSAEALMGPLGLNSAWRWTLVALDILNLGVERSPWLLNANFLDTPQSYPLRYVWLKHKTKDSWISALSYSMERMWSYHLRPRLFGRAVIGHDI